jgi:hypothetical protein
MTSLILLYLLIMLYTELHLVAVVQLYVVLIQDNPEASVRDLEGELKAYFHVTGLDVILTTKWFPSIRDVAVH